MQTMTRPSGAAEDVRWMAAMRAEAVRQRSLRVCLGCGHKFPSSGPGNRICYRCSQHDQPAIRMAKGAEAY